MSFPPRLAGPGDLAKVGPLPTPVVGRINQGPPVSGGGVPAPLSGGRAPIQAETKTKTNEAGPVDQADTRSDPRTLLGLHDAAAKNDWRRGKKDPAA